MSEKKEPKYKDEKATRVRLDEDTEYIAVIIDEDTSLGFEAGVSLPKGANVGLERERKKRVLATYIKDRNYGLLPENLWIEQKRVEVAGTLSTHVNTPFTAEQVTVTSGVKPRVWTSCPKCSGAIIAGSKFCRNCGEILKPD